VKTLAAEHRALSEQLGEEERGVVVLERERADAIAAEHRVQQLEGALREAEAERSVAQASLFAVEQEVEARAALAREAEQLSAGTGGDGQAAAELAQARAHAQAGAAGARAAADEAGNAATAARAALDAATEDHHRACRRDEATRVAAALHAAEGVAGDL